ncbi:GDSL-type esterase/lipase family protein [Streptomyces sp. URMC 123]|uniref:SGNH/GDSL hydrolase family protein n=1 Tax=Streptomyces sp. URMC 123 TaxID=3423403 RepID=UPI003F1A1528
MAERPRRPAPLAAALVTAVVLALVCTATALTLPGRPGHPGHSGRPWHPGNSGHPGEPRDRVARAAHPAQGLLATRGGWTGTWATAPAAAEPRTDDGYAGMSIRNIVRTSIGGSRARVELSNLYGRTPLTISHATVALAARHGGPAAAPGTLRRLTFHGSPSVTVPAGRSVLSDAARLTVPPAADLLVTTYSGTPSGPVTHHPHARQTSYLARGDKAGDASGAAYTRRTTVWRYLTAVDVWNDPAAGAVVALGDSITDGSSATLDANHRWPDFLAARLRTEPGAPRWGVLNEGISGNRVLTDGRGQIPPDNPSALSRFDRDVLSRTGVRAVVVALGVNDILRTPHETDPERIAEGLRTLVARGHARGLRVIGGTIMPFGGFRGHTPELEAVRQAVNERIRAGEVYDAVVDFDAALRDPSRPDRLFPAYDEGDHLHPSDEGYRAMAYAVDLADLAELADLTAGTTGTAAGTLTEPTARTMAEGTDAVAVPVGLPAHLAHRPAYIAAITSSMSGSRTDRSTSG